MQNADIDLRKLLGLLQRQLRLIVITVIAGVGATALVVFSLTPIYQASVLVEVQTRDRNLLDPSGDFSTGIGGDMSRVAGELEIMHSDAVMLKVIDKEALVGDPEYGVRLGLVDRIAGFLLVSQPTLPTGDAALRRVLSNVKAATSVSQIGVSNLISMTVRSQDRDRAAEIANAWAESYVEAQVSAKIDDVLSAKRVLQARQSKARSTLVAAEQSLDGYIGSNLSRIVGETGRADVASIGSDLTRLMADQSQLSSKIEQAKSGLRQKNWELLTKTLQSQALAELERQRSQLAQTIAASSEGDAISLRSELAGIEQRLATLADEQVAGLDKAVSDNQSKEADLRQRLRSAVLSSSLPADMLSDIFELQQNAELSRQEYQTILARTQQLDAQATLQVADGRVVSPALAPEQPSFPNIPIALVGAGILSLALGIGFAFFRENLVGGLLTEDQTEAVLGVRVAAVVPRLRGAHSANGALADQMISSPLSQFPEAIRRIRVTVDQMMRRLGPSTGQQKRGIVLVITSATANEGKSTIALSLARAFAGAHQRTCLIDSDLRRPSIQKMLGLPTSNLLVEFLAQPEQSASIGGILTLDETSGVAIIAAGGRIDVPTDHLIGGPNFTMLLEEARAHFDVVVLDTPPVGPVADTLYLAGHADLVLFVVMSGRTSQTEARIALAHLRTALGPDTPILAVLNGQERASANYKGTYGNVYYQQDG